MDMSLSKLWELVMDMGSLACCDSWGHKESDVTEQLNWTELMMFLHWLMMVGSLVVLQQEETFIPAGVSKLCE